MNWSDVKLNAKVGLELRGARQYNRANELYQADPEHYYLESQGFRSTFILWCLENNEAVNQWVATGKGQHPLDERPVPRGFRIEWVLRKNGYRYLIRSLRYGYVVRGTSRINTKTYRLALNIAYHMAWEAEEYQYEFEG